MNRQLNRLALVSVLLLVALVVATTYWQAWASAGLQSRQDNAIQRVVQFTIQRGLIETGPKAIFAANKRRKLNGQTLFFRRYPQHKLAAQTIGYSTAARSQAGLEQSMNDYLTGSNTNLSNAFKRALDKLGGGTVKGNSLLLTLRPAAQRIAQQQLGTRCGAVVAMNVHTGAVYVMASTPSYDPNQISTNYASVLRIRGDCGQGFALLNRATAGLYTPGSTFKIITAAAALDTGAYTPASTFEDPGYCTVYGKKVSNAGNPDQNGPEAFGHVNLVTGFEHSINSVFCNIGLHIGAKTHPRLREEVRLLQDAAARDTGERACSERPLRVLEDRPSSRRSEGSELGRRRPARLRADDDARDAAADGDGGRDRRQRRRRAEAVRRPEDRRAGRLDRAHTPIPAISAVRSSRRPPPT